MRKIGVSLQGLSHALMFCKLLPVVEGERVRLVLIERQQLHNGFVHHGCAFALYRLKQREPGLALYQRHQIALAAVTHHGIRFPVANPGPLVHDLRALVANHPVTKLSPPLLVDSALTIGFLIP